MRAAGLAFALLGAWSLVGVGPALAEGRHALVIGIDAYREVPELEKATGDAKALAASLQALGFSVDLVLDADRRELNRAIAEFQSKIAPGDTALIHFSGHGVEIDGQNYLLPADIPKPQSGEQDFIKSEAISLGDLMQRVSASGAATRIFVIDACRDNPFAESGTRGLGGERGLTRVEAPAGTFVLYSAGYAQTALDRLSDTDSEPTSVYTRVLMKHMSEPGIQLADLAREVRSEVESLAKSVGHDQRPAYYDELSGQFSFRQASTGPAASDAPSASAAPISVAAPAPSVAAPSIDERGAFETAQGIGTAAAWDGFLKSFPSGFYADMARAARDKLASSEEQASAVEQPATFPRSTQAAPPADQPADFCSRIETFVSRDYLGGDLGDADHVRGIYAARVDYWNKGQVPVGTVIADKLAYVKKWPMLRFQLDPASLTCTAIPGLAGSYRVNFAYDYRAANRAKTVEGQGKSELIVDLSGPEPRITREAGEVVSRK